VWSLSDEFRRTQTRDGEKLGYTPLKTCEKVDVRSRLRPAQEAPSRTPLETEDMSRIVRFAITGLAGRKGVYEQTLDPQLNVFFGANGSGKTSLLRVLDSALSGQTGQLARVPFREADVWIQPSTDDVEYRLHTARPQHRQRVVSRMPDGTLVAVHADVPKADEKIEWTATPALSPVAMHELKRAYLPTSRLYVAMQDSEPDPIRYSEARTRRSEEQLDRYFAQQMQRLWSDYSARTLSVVRRAQEEGLASILRTVLTLSSREETPEELDADTAFRRVAAFLSRQGATRRLRLTQETFRDLYAEREQVRHIVADINKVEQRIDRAMAPRNRLQELITQLYSGNKSIRFLDTEIEVATNEGTVIGLESLSSGEKHLLRLFVEALRIGLHGTVLIDEPEISLHIEWQRRLVFAFTELNPTSQFILATHAPEIMAEVPDSKIFRL
jgi:predicted ATP-dependent endonuclease of OLD family